MILLLIASKSALLTKYSQMALDYGYPILKASDDTPDAGRLHLSVQLQF